VSDCKVWVYLNARQEGKRIGDVSYCRNGYISTKIELAAILDEFEVQSERMFQFKEEGDDDDEG